jgi:hypothetical protein
MPCIKANLSGPITYPAAHTYTMFYRFSKHNKKHKWHKELFNGKQAAGNDKDEDCKSSKSESLGYVWFSLVYCAAGDLKKMQNYYEL